VLEWDSRRGFGLDIQFFYHFNTHLVITFNGTIANLHTLKKSLAHTLSLSARSVFTSNCLVTASNNGYSCAFEFKSSLNDGSVPAAFSSLTDWLSTDWVPAWRPFHANHVIFFSQPDFQLSTLATNWLPQTVPVIISALTAQKTPFLCYLFSCCRSVVAYKESAA
jgi:hypothetical protein